MPKLTEPQKRFVVERLAQYYSPSETAELVKEAFGIEMDRAHVRAYNPEQVVVAKRWIAVFEAARAAWKKSYETPIANQTWRLRELEIVYRRNKARGADRLAAQFLKRAAEEKGDVYTNHRQIGVTTSHFLDPDRQGDGSQPMNAEQAEALFAVYTQSQDPVAAATAVRQMRDAAQKAVDDAKEVAN